jgi:hypothetical protein
MNIREISDIFKDTAADITALKSYNFGWASDRVRQGNTEDFQELNEFPRVFFAVPTITGSDQTRKQDTYQVTLFFDDLLGYDNEGDEDPTLQIDKWANLQQYANYFVQRLNKIKQSILPNYLFIPEAPTITFDSFTGLQRMITVQLSFNLVVPTNCDPSIITLVQCIANIITSSNLTASLTTVLKFAASLEGRATVTADINFVQKAQASLLATGTTTADLTVVSSVDADAQAFFDRVTTAGGTLTTTEQNAVNTLVVQMKADGIWTKMKAIYPMVGASAAACAQNLKSSSFTGLFTSGWTFANAGVTGNGTSAYMNTNFIPSTGYLNSSNFGLFLYTSSTTAGSVDRDLAIFTGGGVPSLNLTAKDGTSAKADLFDFGYRISISGYNVQGFYIGSRTASNSAKLHRNGIEIGSTTGPAGIAPSTYLTLGAANLSSSNPISGTGNYSAKTFSLVGICDGLNDTEAANFYTAVQAFQTTLNRQV